MTRACAGYCVSHNTQHRLQRLAHGFKLQRCAKRHHCTLRRVRGKKNAFERQQPNTKHNLSSYWNRTRYLSLATCLVLLSAFTNRTVSKCKDTIPFLRELDITWDIHSIFSLWFEHRENRARKRKVSSDVLCSSFLRTLQNRTPQGVFCVSQRQVAACHKCILLQQRVLICNTLQSTCHGRNIAENYVDIARVRSTV
jgi:hypothetical protein